MPRPFLAKAAISERPKLVDASRETAAAGPTAVPNLRSAQERAIAKQPINLSSFSEVDSNDDDLTGPGRAWEESMKAQRISTLKHVLPDGEIHLADAVKFLINTPSASGDIIFLDPPFNLGKQYGKNSDRLADQEYREFIHKILDESVRILSPGGALYLYHIPKWAIEFSSRLSTKLTFRHWIAVSMKNGFVRGKRLYPAHYALLYYTKGEASHFSRPKIPKPVCWRCKRQLRDYGGYEKYVSNGINLSDVWDDVSPLRHKKHKTRNSNELPLIIPERATLISGFQGGTLVDPFAGAGSSLIAARAMGMRFIGCDRESEYCDLIFQRLTVSLESESVKEIFRGTQESCEACSKLRGTQASR